MDLFEWDPDKALSNLRKHGVSFADAVTALEDDRALTIEDEHAGERRFVTVGIDAHGRLLVVVYTFREEKMRIISARKANAQEHKQYEED